MYVYIWLFWHVSLFCCIIDMKKNRMPILRVKKNSIKVNMYLLICYVSMFIPLFLVMGTREKIGKDYLNYEYIFDVAAKEHLNVNHVETGYYLLNVLVGFFTKNSKSIFIVVAAIMVALYLKGFSDNSKKILISMTTFMGMGYYFYGMNIMRQYLAMSIMCVAFQFLEKKLYKKFTVYLLIAFMFHFSVLVWIPMILAIKYFRGKKFYFITFGIMFAIRIGYGVLVKFIIAFTPYAHFFESGHNFIKPRISWTNIAITMLVIVAYIFRKKQMLSINKENSVRIKYIWVMFLSYLFLNVLGDSVVRIALNFFFIIPIVMTDFFESFNSTNKRCLKFVYVCMMFGFMYFLLNYAGNIENHFVPYKSFLIK